MKDCNQCGKCCLKYGGQNLATSDEEIALWEIFNPEIYRYVKNGKIWHDPDTGAKLHKCPFLRMATKPKTGSGTQYLCDIYLNRPEDCRLYPSEIGEMVRDECEMIEAVDLLNIAKAQDLLKKHS
ncbi:YkgJ family cysteine cluster protein [uncultured Pseudoteredinibacter sp.]|uniref:YkgJ family cysteine cluster protein n=1 Tax=uncultured Pseudoteredinibacter sp. TaxID=1641701 RepID=UPI00261DF2C9|nr:YkgJ family cysteine cluster protein [uncultured Pseudoteredinibacter sp.]